MLDTLLVLGFVLSWNCQLYSIKSTGSIYPSSLSGSINVNLTALTCLIRHAGITSQPSPCRLAIPKVVCLSLFLSLFMEDFNISSHRQDLPHLLQEWTRYAHPDLSHPQFPLSPGPIFSTVAYRGFTLRIRY